MAEGESLRRRPVPTGPLGEFRGGEAYLARTAASSTPEPETVPGHITHLFGSSLKHTGGPTPETAPTTGVAAVTSPSCENGGAPGSFSGSLPASLQVAEKPAGCGIGVPIPRGYSRARSIRRAETADPLARLRQRRSRRSVGPAPLVDGVAEGREGGRPNRRPLNPPSESPLWSSEAPFPLQRPFRRSS